MGRNPVGRKIPSDRFSYHRIEFQSNTCNNCKRHGHFARDCPNVCLNSWIPVCWNCRESGHMANSCTNQCICHRCGIAGHHAKDCTARHLPPGDLRLCNKCYKQGHFAADCNNCRKTGHLARDCTADPVCNHCNLSGHLAIKRPKTNAVAGDRGGGYHREQYEEEIVCRNCRRVGHMSRDCMAHIAYECPCGRFVNNLSVPLGTKQATRRSFFA